jgi:hypothetical protein
MTCPNDRRLFEVETGDGSAADRAHVATCPACAERRRALARDLARLDGVLRGPAPALRRARPARAWQLVPLAAAVLLFAAVLSGRNDPATVDGEIADAYALADEVAALVAGDVGLDDDGDDTTTASTCTYGDPLLGVGCDEPAVMQIAWR